MLNVNVVNFMFFVNSFTVIILMTICRAVCRDFPEGGGAVIL